MSGVSKGNDSAIGMRPALDRPLRLLLVARLGGSAAFAAAAVILGFASVRGPLPALDVAGAHLLYPSGAWAASAISLCASAYGVTIVSIALFVVALATRRGLAATVAVVAIQLASAQTVSFLKYWFDRPRPVHHIVLEAMPSYPSGHAAGAMAFFGGVAWLVVTSRMSSSWKRWVAGALCVLIIAIGWSRVALGAHYVTDVIGGYLMGAAWLLVGTVVFDLLFRPKASDASRAGS